MPKHSSHHSNRRGFTSLEYAIVLPVVLAFIFGAIDVANYFRAYTAVKEGVHAGLRCLYPTDGACTQSEASKTIPVNDLYLPPFFAESKDYNGMEKHLILPNYRFGAIQAKTLQDVQYNIHSTRYATQRNLYDGEAELKYFIERLPGVVGTYNNALIRDGVALSVSGNPDGHVRCSQADSISIGKITFQTPPAPLQGEAGYELMDDCLSFKYDGAVNGICSVENAKNRARLFINLRGDGYTLRNGRFGSNSDVSGHVDIELWYADQQGRFRKGEIYNISDERSFGSLGGQGFDAHSNENFIPRGISAEETSIIEDPNLPLHVIPHLSKYARVSVPYGINGEIRFTLRGMGGAACDNQTDVGWRLSSAQIRIPEYSLDREILSCSDPRPLSQCGNCSINARNSKYFPTLHSRVGPPIRVWCNQVIGADDRVEHSVCYPSEPSLSTLLQGRNVTGLASDYTLAQISGNGCPTTESQGCDANFGVATPSQFENDSSYVTSSSEAHSICPPPPYAIGDAIRWRETVQTVYPPATDVKEADCSIRPGTVMPINLVPSEIEQYKKLILPRAQYLSSGPSYKYSGDPDLLIQSSLFNCSAVSTERIFYDENHQQNFAEEERAKLLQSYFVGPQHQLGCGTEQILKQEAVRIGMNSGAYFEVTRDAIVEGQRYQASSIDACMVVRPELSLLAGNLRSKIQGGPFDEGVVPVQCVVQGVEQCIALPAGVRELDPGGTFSVDAQGAETRAVQAIQALMPSTKFSSECAQTGGLDCGQIKINGGSVENEFDPLNDPFRIEATIEVPLLILANKSLTVRYSSERGWEGRYLHHTQTF